MEEDESDHDLLEKNSTPKSVTFDDILLSLGEFGRYQKVLYFLFSLPYVLTSMQLLGWVFTGAELPHKCQKPPEICSNTTTCQALQCSILINNESSIPCQDNYEFDTRYIRDSVIKDWSLICDKVLGSSSMNLR